MVPFASNTPVKILRRHGPALIASTALAAFAGQSAQAQSVIDNGMAEIIDPTGGATMPSPWSPAGLLFIGNGAEGSLTIRNGGALNSGLTFVGAAGTGVGTVSVDGAGSTWINSSSLMLGDSGQGTLEITAGGRVFNNHAYIGYGPGSAGFVKVDGFGSTWMNGMTLFMGREGHGTLTLSNGGVVNAPDVELAEYASSESRIIIGAAEGEDAAAAGTLEAGIVQFGAGTGTIVFNHLDNNYDFDAALISGSGTGIIRHIAGDTTFTALSPQFTGTTELVGGSVAISGELGGDVVMTGGALSVDGRLGGNVDMLAGMLSVAGTIGGNVEMTEGEAAVGGLVEGDFIIHDGSLALDGTIAGDVTLYRGRLDVDGGIGGTIEMHAGRIGGTGTIGDLVLNTTATLAPGNSIGTLNARSAVIHAHSVYEVELSDGGNTAGVHNDWLKASDTVTLNGGVVYVRPENRTDDGTSYLPGTTYTIVTADGGLTGEFSTIVDDFAYLNFVDSYDANNVFLISTLATNSLCLSTMTANQCAAAQSVESTAGGTLFAAAMSLSETEVHQAFDQLTGEIHASLRTALLDGGSVVRDAAFARMRIDDAHAGGAWVMPYGSWHSWDGDGNVASMSVSSYGALAGADVLLGDHVRAGLFGGYGRDRLAIDNRSSSADIDHWTVGGMASAHWQGLRLTGGAAYRWHGIDSSRDVAFAGIVDRATASYDARSAQLFGEASYTMTVGNASFSPFAGLAYFDLDTDGFAETGGATALSALAQSTSATFATIGLRGEVLIPLEDRDLRLNGMAGYRHAAGGDAGTSLALSGGGDPFTIAGQTVGRNAFLIEGGVAFDLSSAARLSIDYDGEFASNGHRHGVRAAVTAAF